MMQADAPANFVADTVKHIRADIAKLQAHLNAKYEDYDYPVELPARERALRAISDAALCADFAEEGWYLADRLPDQPIDEDAQPAVRSADPIGSLVQLVSALRSLAVAWSQLHSGKKLFRDPRIEWTPKKLITLQRNYAALMATGRYTRDGTLGKLAPKYESTTGELGKRLTEANKLYGMKGKRARSSPTSRTR